MKDLIREVGGDFAGIWFPLLGLLLWPVCLLFEFIAGVLEEMVEWLVTYE